jgi:hypothetical protein
MENCFRLTVDNKLSIDSYLRISDYNRFNNEIDLVCQRGLINSASQQLPHDSRELFKRAFGYKLCQAWEKRQLDRQNREAEIKAAHEKGVELWDVEPIRPPPARRDQQVRGGNNRGGGRGQDFRGRGFRGNQQQFQQNINNPSPLSAPVNNITLSRLHNNGQL